MKYGKYIESKVKKEWDEHYIEYKALKDLIKECQKEAEIAGETSFSPRTTSLTVQRYANQKDSYHEKFFRKLEHDVSAQQGWILVISVDDTSTLSISARNVVLMHQGLKETGYI